MTDEFTTPEEPAQSTISQVVDGIQSATQRVSEAVVVKLDLSWTNSLWACCDDFRKREKNGGPINEHVGCKRSLQISTWSINQKMTTVSS
jgi:hypothetical protein